MLKLSILALAVILAATASADAHGAVATGGVTADSPYGSAYGISYSWATKAEADARALAECEKHRGTTGLTCQIVTDFIRQWASVAIDPKGGTPGFGWALGLNKKTAEAAALDRCKATSPEERKSFCAVSLTYHDQKP